LQWDAVATFAVQSFSRNLKSGRDLREACIRYGEAIL
jgi:hypothetical protein